MFELPFFYKAKFERPHSATEIAGYGCLASYSRLMEHAGVESLLAETLAEEKDTDSLLTDIAINKSNVGASA